MVTSGKIYVVSTPIGNLGDMTHRAVETLKSVNFILCEDTRVTKILLDHYEIKGELISFNAATESKKMEYAVDKILNGANCALVSDAGTPTISDPGGRFINLALKNDIEVVSVPGASAIISALSISGLPTDAFVFEGFLPQKKGRQKKLVELAQEERTIVLYESVYRITNLLEELKQYMPERMVVVFRELTKKFEERWKGYPQDLLAELESKVIKGEFVVVIAPINWKDDMK
jgi:16S rRNA (cytidine1402-2'-O)-methyltransferase